MRVGINTEHPESRIGQMLAFGRDGMLDRDQVLLVSAYVFSLSNPDYSTPDTVDRIEAGREVFVANCASCHGEDARGMQEVRSEEHTSELQSLMRISHSLLRFLNKTM